MLLKELSDKKLIKAPAEVISNCMYLTIAGSHAYGVADTSNKKKMPDYDIYGFCVPRKEVAFPQFAGVIRGFGYQGESFEKPYQAQHVFDKDALGGKGKEYDINVYNIIRYFDLCMNGNPNMLDSMYTPINCVLHNTTIGNLVREKRHLFLSKKIFHTYKGYAYSQLNKMDNKELREGISEIRDYEDAHGIPRATTHDEITEAVKKNQSFLDLTPEQTKTYHVIYTRLIEQSKRYENVKIYGIDTKHAYHILRLVNQAEQLMTEGDMDLQRNNEQLKDVRRGNWTGVQIREWFARREKELNTIYDNCKILPHVPNEAAVKQLLIDCLEEHYGDLSKCVSQPDKATTVVQSIKHLIEQAGL